MAFGLQSPIDVDNLSGLWFQQTGQHMRSLICVGASAILWSIWICRMMGRSKKRLYSYLQEDNLLDSF